MYKKLVSFLLLIVVVFSLTSCESNEINLKIITDAIVMTNESLYLVKDSTEKPEIYKTNYKTFKSSIRNIKKKYDQTPFLSHSKIIVISAEITVNELASYIKELKNYYQIPPDIKVTLAENEAIELVEKGELTIKEMNIYIKNCCNIDSRICTFENNLLGQKFPLIYESDGNICIKTITI